MRRNIRRHADSDARRSVCQQMRKLGRKHDRFGQRAIVILAEVDGILVQPVKQRLGHHGKTRFGVSAGGRVVAVDIAKVTLPIDQRITDVEILRQSRHRVVDRAIAMRVIVAHHVAADLGGLTEAPGAGQAQFAHRIEDSPMHRLKPVARIRQRAVHDRRERISQITLANRATQRFGYLPEILGALHVGVIDVIIHIWGGTMANEPGKDGALSYPQAKAAQPPKDAACVFSTA